MTLVKTWFFLGIGLFFGRYYLQSLHEYRDFGAFLSVMIFRIDRYIALAFSFGVASFALSQVFKALIEDYYLWWKDDSAAGLALVVDSLFIPIFLYFFWWFPGGAAAALLIFTFIYGIICLDLK